MAILRTIVWFLFFILSLVVIIPQMYRAKRLKSRGDTKASRELIDRYVQWWMKSLMKLAGCRVEVSGLENIPKDRSVVFMANHQGNYDVPITMTYLGAPPAMIAKIETRKIPLVRTWMELLDCIFIDREDPRQAIGAMRNAGEILASGRSILAFPEGTRSQGDEMNPFKTGVFKIPFHAGAPIVPVVIDGSYKIMEANHGLMRPGTVKLKVLPAIETRGMDRARQKLIPAEVEKLIKEAKEQG